MEACINATDYAAKLKIEMAAVKHALVEPGVQEFVRYRELVARYQALQWAHAQLKIQTTEEDQE